MNNNHLPKIQVNTQEVTLSGGNAYIREENQRPFFIYNNTKLTIPENIRIQTSEREDYAVKIEHKPSTSILKIHNNAENLKITYMDKTANPMSSIKIRTDKLTVYGQQEPIRFYHYDTEATFRITPVEEQADDEEDEMADEVIRPPLTNQYTNKDGRPSKDIKSILRKSSQATSIGSGAYRSAYKVDASEIEALQENDGAIIKVASKYQGIRANKYEVQTWQAVKHTDQRKYFCPITSIGPNHKYIVMKEATDVGSVRTRHLDDFKNKIEQMIGSEEDAGSPMGHSLDIHGNNVGTFKGRKVLIDYPYGANFELQEPDGTNILGKLLNKIS